VLAAGLLLVAAAGAAGIALGTRFSHPLAGVLGALALLVLFAQSYRLLAYPALGGLPWLFPWTTPDQLGALPGPLAGYPPGGAHAVELAGIAVLAGAVAVAAAGGRGRHRAAAGGSRYWTVLAGTAIAAVAAIGVSSAAQLQPIPTATLDRLFSVVANPTSGQHCVTADQVRYCLYPGFGTQLPVFRGPVSGVLGQLPARPARVLTVAQATSLELDDPPLAHGLTKQQIARWSAELLAAPPSTAAAPAIYVTVADERAADFALALGTAEWAVNLLPGASPGTSGPACVALDQAREAIAIWLAITATHASATGLQSGQSLTYGHGALAVFVRNTQVIVWIYPGETDNYISPSGPQTTAVGFLLAKAMTSLPEGKVESVLRAAWPTWLNWHTTDAQLAAALGIQMPKVPAPPLPPSANPAAQQQSPVCT
jgi:hypothetical protein